MTYMLRDLPDGQVEITISRPLADRFVAFLKHEEPELIEEEPAGFGTAQADAAEAETLNLGEIVTETPKPKRRRKAVTNLPAVIDQPTPTAFLPVLRPVLTELQLDEAFARLGGGEKLASVAISFGVPMAQLRGYWAAHCRQVQRHIAEAGKQPCSLCQTPFVPSISHPDSCARCNHG
ncbi:MAG: hypothetical protein A2092_12010 [Rhodobacteraceae bacterium GWE1_64_9]|nr:MAG: hypothetical protein A2092_12010 [Rhodobacteraceae bacterium GWE1_64_9]HBD91793.1 hypothetical protein [Gemmobacter sp.]HBU14066.1 hypothetical protein [Gemmobacter sp.]